MSIRIQRPVISSFFLRLSRGFFATFFVSFPKSPHFLVIIAIDAATVRRSEAQLRSRQPRTETATLPASTAPSSSVGGVTLEAIITQLVWVDVRLDTLNEELCQVNTHVSRIA